MPQDHLRALGRSVLGVDLDQSAERIANSLNTALAYIADRSGSPLRVPGWVPTLARRRARRAAAVLCDLSSEVLRVSTRCQQGYAPGTGADGGHRPETGQRLSDNEIRDQLIIFMVAGHDTTNHSLMHCGSWVGIPRLRGGPRPSSRQLGTERLPTMWRRCPINAVVHGRCDSARRVRRSDAPRPATSRSTATVCRLDHGHLRHRCGQRDPALWDRPDEFDPDRFLGAAAKSRPVAVRAVRSRPADMHRRPLRDAGSHTGVATVLRRIEVTSVDDDFPVEFPFTMVAAGPIRAVAHRRW